MSILIRKYFAGSTKCCLIKTPLSLRVHSLGFLLFSTGYKWKKIKGWFHIFLLFLFAPCIGYAEWHRFCVHLWRAFDLEADVKAWVDALGTSAEIRLVINLHISLSRTQSNWKICGRKSAITTVVWNFKTIATGCGHIPTALWEKSWSTGSWETGT